MTSSPADARSPRRRSRSVRRKRAVWIVGAAILALIAAAAFAAMGLQRHEPPTGQVVAVVDGREITRQDLEAEARAMGAPAPGGPELLDRVVRRVLLVQAAKARKLDQTAAYPSDKARADDLVLAEALLRTLPPASATDSAQAAFVQAHPEGFAERRRYTVVRLEFPGSARVFDSLSSAASLSEARGKAEQEGVHATERTQVVYSDQLPAALERALRRLTPQGVVVIRAGESVEVFGLVDSIPAPPSDEEAKTKRYEGALRRARQAALDRVLEGFRRAARITYQPGYGPPGEPHSQPPSDLR